MSLSGSSGLVRDLAFQDLLLCFTFVLDMIISQIVPAHTRFSMRDLMVRSRW